MEGWKTVPAVAGNGTERLKRVSPPFSQGWFLDSCYSGYHGAGSSLGNSVGWRSVFSQHWLQCGAIPGWMWCSDTAMLAALAPIHVLPTQLLTGDTCCNGTSSQVWTCCSRKSVSNCKPIRAAWTKHSSTSRTYFIL